MAYVWTKDLETGNALIDTQHKQLINALNELLDACNSGKGRAEMDRMINFLVQYTTAHFADEERLQQQSNYPGYAAHKRFHDTFTRVVKDLAAELGKNGPTLSLIFKVNHNVGDWLINHIKKEDTKVAAHIKNAAK